jgi:hypothetical protein
MLKRFFNFLFGKKEVPTVTVELNTIEVSAAETVKPIDDVYFPVTALADATLEIAAEKTKKARKSRGPKKPKAVVTETVATDVETTEVKPKKRRYYKPRKKKTDTGSVSSPEKSL